MSNHGNELLGVQALRFFAAGLVVVTHATLAVVERLRVPGFEVWSAGGAGVDIFFVISGFVMLVSSQKLLTRPDGWRLFFMRRVVRIAPLYWFATTLKLIAVLAVPAVTLHSAVDLPHLVSSYFFLPARNVEGEVKPLLSVGWTLIYEMFFYAVFAVSLWARRPPVLTVGIVFAILVGLGMLFGRQSTIAVYADPIILEFVVGMIIARIWLSGAVVSASVAFLLLFVGVVALIFHDAVSDLPRIIGWGVPSALVVVGIVFLEPFLRKVLPALILAMGDASYSIYLFHGLLLPVIGVIVAKLGWREPMSYVAVATALSFAVGWSIYKLIEKPTTDYLKQKVVA